MCLNAKLPGEADARQDIREREAEGDADVAVQTPPWRQSGWEGPKRVPVPCNATGAMASAARMQGCIHSEVGEAEHEAVGAADGLGDSDGDGDPAT